MAMALRPLRGDLSTSSRWGSQALEVGLRPGRGGPDGGAVSESVDTSLAGFGGGRRPQSPGDRTGTPAALGYLLAVSRRTPVARSIGRNGQPRRPSARSCCFLSLLKTLAILGTDQKVHAVVNARAAISLAGFQVSIHCRSWVSTEVCVPA